MISQNYTASSFETHQRIALFGGNRHHLASPNPTRTDPEPMALS